MPPRRPARAFAVLYLCGFLAGGATSASGQSPEAASNGASGAPANPSAPVAELAREAFERGRRQAEAGHWARAEAAFRASLEHVDRTGTRYNLAVALFYQGYAARCLDELHRIETRPGLLVSDRQQASIDDLRTRALADVTVLRLDPSPADARLQVDGAEVHRSEAGALAFLPPGRHRLRATAPGRTPVTREVVARPGREITLAIALGPASASQPTPEAGPAAASAPPPTGPTPGRAPRAPVPSRSVVPWLLVGTGGALAAGALATGLLSLAADRRVSAACEPDVPCDRPDLRSDKVLAEDLALVTDVLWISGAVLVVSGTVWLLLRPSNGEEGGEQASRLNFNVAAGPGSAAAVARLRF